MGQAEAAAAKTILDQAVTQKQITRAQETAFLDRLQNSGDFGPGPGGPGDPGGHGGPRPAGGSAATGATPSATR